MRRGPLAFLVVAALSLTGCFFRGGYPARFGGQVPLRLINQSPMVVYTVNISPSSSGYWGDDWLGAATIPPGGVFDFGVQPGIYDIRANASNGMVLAEARGIDLRGAQQLLVTPGGFASAGAAPGYGAPAGGAYADPSQGGYAQPAPPPGYGASGAVQVNAAPQAPPVQAPPPPAAQTFSLTLHSDCPQTVGLFHGSGRPPSGSGTYTSIGANTTQSFSGLAGEQFWIIDGNRNGVSAFTPSGTQRMAILNSCNGFVPQ